VVASMVVGGHHPPGGSSEWSRLITYNNQILEGVAGGVMAWRLSSSAWARRRCVAPYQCLSHRRLQRRRRHPSPEAPPSISKSKMGGRARLGWLWEARRGGASVIIWRLFFRGASNDSALERGHHSGRGALAAAMVGVYFFT